mmetsp:Transcript_17070/g.32685  ORF Transcript_17070/g.32685 Transcript_17070/m.32685 type:complete len:353 (-) Transcript_17070:2031-3089(-)
MCVYPQSHMRCSISRGSDPTACILGALSSITTIGGGRRVISSVAPSSTQPSIPSTLMRIAPTSRSFASTSSRRRTSAGRVQFTCRSSLGSLTASSTAVAPTPASSAVGAPPKTRMRISLITCSKLLLPPPPPDPSRSLAVDASDASRAVQLAQNAGESDPRGVLCTESSSLKPFCFTLARMARTCFGRVSNATALWPRAAAARLKKPTPAPTSTSTADLRCPPRLPTSASASPGRRVGCTPGCHVPQLVMELDADSMGAEGSFARAASPSSPSMSTKMSNGGSHIADTGNRSVTITGSCCCCSRDNAPVAPASATSCLCSSNSRPAFTPDSERSLEAALFASSTVSGMLDHT